ncbi:MAG: MFS transporter [Thermoleophilia bacterium]|nr:MFS transporter [Thermoleophilia bacterium]
MKRALTALLICDLAIFVDVVGSGIVIPAIPQFAQIFGASEGAMGYAFSAFAVGFLLTALPLGVLVDRTGRSGLVVGAGMVSIVLAGVLFATATSLWTFAAAQALHGVGSAAAWVSGQPLAARIAQNMPRRGVWFGSITIAMGLGLIAGPLIGSIGELRLPFVIYIVMAAIAALLAFWLLRHERAPGTARGLEYLAVLRNPRVLAACLAVMVLYAGVGMSEVLFPLFMDARGYPKSGIGVLFFALALAMSLTQPLVTHWLDRVGHSRPSVAAFVVVAATLSAMVLGDTYATWVPVFVFLGVATGILVSGSMMIIAAGSRAGEHGLGYAAWNFSFSIGYLVGPALGGALVELTRGWGAVGGLRAPFFVLSLLTLVSVPLFRMLMGRGRVAAAP